MRCDHARLLLMSRSTSSMTTCMFVPQRCPVLRGVAVPDRAGYASAVPPHADEPFLCRGGDHPAIGREEAAAHESASGMGSRRVGRVEHPVVETEGVVEPHRVVQAHALHLRLKESPWGSMAVRTNPK